MANDGHLADAPERFSFFSHQLAFISDDEHKSDDCRYLSRQPEVHDYIMLDYQPNNDGHSCRRTVRLPRTTRRSDSLLDRLLNLLP